MTSSKTVRAAKGFLQKRGVKGISPREFAEASTESGQSFAELLKSLAEKANDVTSA